jgi:hypothetical protein
MTTAPADEALVKELQRKLDVWHWNAVTWEWVHWLFGIMGVAFSALSAAEYIQDEVASSFAVATTICLGVLGFANPQRRSARYIRSYRVLDTALREFKNSSRTLEDMLKEHRRAEDLLNETEGAEIK